MYPTVFNLIFGSYNIVISQFHYLLSILYFYFVYLYIFNNVLNSVFYGAWWDYTPRTNNKSNQISLFLSRSVSLRNEYVSSATLLVEDDVHPRYGSTCALVQLLVIRSLGAMPFVLCVPTG